MTGAAAPGLLLLGLNAAAGVLMVFVLKALLSRDLFSQGTTLCALHYVSCYYFFGSRPSTAEKRLSIRRQDVIIFAIAANLSIVTLTWSLKFNELFVYQLSKVARVPVTCVLEYLVFRKVPTVRNTIAGSAVVLGVTFATFNKLYVSTHTGGVAWALLALLSTCLQQVLVRQYHIKYSMTSRELLAQTSHAQAISLVAIGPLADRLITGRWLWEETSTPTTITLVVVSCLLALATNWSQFACLRRFAASSFQILGHTKSLMVLLGGWLLYGDSMTGAKLVGVATTAIGLAAYAHGNLREKPARHGALPTKQAATVAVIEDKPRHITEAMGNFVHMFPTSPSGFMVGPPTPGSISPKRPDTPSGKSLSMGGAPPQQQLQQLQMCTQANGLSVQPSSVYAQ